jgi:hypothetical protein
MAASSSSFFLVAETCYSLVERLEVEGVVTL